uniref:Sodium channel, voltage-gated, type IV, beta b n=2 Tax=Gasterosteus aculeatus aculeatus TaxID=481459 RepID=G3QAJ6_GASAC
MKINACRKHPLPPWCTGVRRAGCLHPDNCVCSTGTCLVRGPDSIFQIQHCKPEKPSGAKGYFTSYLGAVGSCSSICFETDKPAAMEVQWLGVEFPRPGPPHRAVGLIFSILLGAWSAQALEMLVGKIPFLQAVNGSTVMLPCSYASCIGIEDLYFNWQFNDNGTMQKVCDSVIASETSVPKVAIYRERVEFVGMNRANNISILLWNITFEDGGEYTCFGRNPKEKGRNHSAIFHLLVVDELKVVDNTLTIMIASAVGGAIAALMGFMLLKNFTLYVLSKLEERNKECLVTSSGIDNTENGLSGSKADSKPTPKKK